MKRSKHRYRRYARHVSAWYRLGVAIANLKRTYREEALKDYRRWRRFWQRLTGQPQVFTSREIFAILTQRNRKGQYRWRPSKGKGTQPTIDGLPYKIAEGTWQI